MTKRVLIVDDENDLRRLLCCLLETEGYEVADTAEPQAALHAVASWDPDIVLLDEKSVDLTPKEFDLLAFLAASPRRVFTRSELLEEVWSSSTAWQDPDTVTEHVRRLRRKIESDPDRPEWITTVRGVGYRFDPAGWGRRADPARPELVGVA